MQRVIKKSFKKFYELCLFAIITNVIVINYSKNDIFYFIFFVKQKPFPKLLISTSWIISFIVIFKLLNNYLYFGFIIHLHLIIFGINPIRVYRFT